MGKQKLATFDELTELLQHLLANKTSGIYALHKNDETSYNLYESLNGLVCTIILPTRTAADALPDAWSKLTHAGQQDIHHRCDGTIVLK